MLRDRTFGVVLSDINLKGMSGIEMLPRVLASTPDIVVMMISGEQTLDRPIESMRAGAFDYIKKPFDLDYVEAAVDRAVEHHSLLATKRAYDEELERLAEQRSAKLNFLALHDTLTGLPNRALFEDRLSQALMTARGEQAMLATVLLSIDRFRKIEHTLGHEQGSRLLQGVAERLKRCDMGGPTIAKMDRDEFGIVLPINGREDAIKAAERINALMASPFLINGREIFITLSMGFSLFPHNGSDVKTLIESAGVALSCAEQQGENGYEFYKPEMNVEANRRLALENDLRRALERDEFEVYYQPKVDVKNGRIAGIEALVRWMHPIHGLVSPSEFVPLAEDTGLIVPIGEWVLRTACLQTKWWRDQGFADLSVSVNLSPRQFQQPSLVQSISEVIGATGFDPNFLELEITETSIMVDPDSAVGTLRQIKEMGIRIAIDDFGTGYSSLGYLRRLPVDILKIDRSFINRITADPDDLTLVMAIISLAHILGLTVVAEGIETAEQLKLLALLRCDSWQGYLFSKPVPNDVFTELLASELGVKTPKGSTISSSLALANEPQNSRTGSAYNP